jgi:hypothetical protein
MPPKKKAKKKKSPELSGCKQSHYSGEFYYQVEPETEMGQRARLNEETILEFQTEREATVNKIKEVCSLSCSDAAKWITIDSLCKQMREIESKLTSKLK